MMLSRQTRASALSAARERCVPSVCALRLPVFRRSLRNEASKMVMAAVVAPYKASPAKASPAAPPPAVGAAAPGRAAKKKSKKLVDILGDVTKDLSNGMFTVKLENGVSVIAHLSGRIRQNRVKILLGDRVTVELSPYDLARGRITYRHRAGAEAAAAAAAEAAAAQ